MKCYVFTLRFVCLNNPELKFQVKKMTNTKHHLLKCICIKEIKALLSVVINSLVNDNVLLLTVCSKGKPLPFVPRPESSHCKLCACRICVASIATIKETISGADPCRKAGVS